MNITKVSVGFGRTRSVNYQGMKFDVSYEAAVQEGELADEVRDVLIKKVTDEVDEFMAKVK